MRFGPAWRFRLLGFPVSVDLSFWLVAVLIGSRRQTDLALVWVAVVFVSILVHELGHAVVARRCGLRPRIELYSMGGLTFLGESARLTPGRSIAVSLAGPGFGFALGALAFAARGLVPPEVQLHAQVAILDLVWVNVVWGLVNLLPLLPLDGGNVMRRLIEIAKRRSDELLALRISMTVAGAAVLLALHHQLYVGAFLAAYLFYLNHQSYRRIFAPAVRPVWR